MGLLNAARVAGNSGHVGDHAQIATKLNSVIDIKADFGAVGDDSTDDTAAVAAAIAAVPSGGTLWAPKGIYRVSSELTVSNRRSVRFIGAGFGNKQFGYGTHFKWTGASGGTMFNFDGWSQSYMSDMSLDGNAKLGGIGLHLNQGSTVVSQMNVWDRILFIGWQKCMQVGTTGGNEGNNDQSNLNKCWFRDSDIGMYFQGDQHIQWFLHTPQFLSCADAAVRVGSASPNGGGLNVYGGALLLSGMGFDLPRFNAPTIIEGMTVENTGIILDSTGSGGSVGRTVTLRNIWQNSATGGTTYAVRFKTGNNLLVEGCHFVLPVEVDNNLTGVTPYRTFINTETTITRSGPTFPYKVIEIGNPSDTTVKFDDVVRAKTFTTAGRPTAASAGAGAQGFDTDLGLPVWSTGSAWKDAAGNTV